MIQTRARSALVSAAIFIGAMLGAYGQAHAAVYRGSWDPAFGAPFAGLGWKGSATFSIPDACLAASGWIDNTTTGCAAGGMKVLGATVDFYNASTDPSGLSVLETLTFSNPSWLVYSMEVTANTLTGVYSGFSEPVNASIPLAGGGAYYFDLAFLDGINGPGSVKGASLFYTKGLLNPTCAFLGSSKCGYSANIAPVTYALVPEPATVALVLAGLGAIGLVAPRRRR